MERIKLMLTGGFLAILTLYLAIFMAITTRGEMELVQADAPVTVEVTVQYASLNDAQPQRDISQQHYASLVDAR
jgi:hypothetical protein